MIRLKRAYEAPSRSDGLRILVERLWPRGLTRQKADIDLWLKELAPSPDLRTWYDHDVQRWAGFQKRYRAELTKQGDVPLLLKRVADHETVTFVYAAKDDEHCSALVLKEFLEQVRHPPS